MTSHVNCLCLDRRTLSDDDVVFCDELVSNITEREEEDATGSRAWRSLRVAETIAFSRKQRVLYILFNFKVTWSSHHVVVLILSSSNSHPAHIVSCLRYSNKRETPREKLYIQLAHGAKIGNSPSM